MSEHRVNFEKGNVDADPVDIGGRQAGMCFIRCVSRRIRIYRFDGGDQRLQADEPGKHRFIPERIG